MATDLPLAFVKRNEREGRRAERMGEGVEDGERERGIGRKSTDEEFNERRV